MIEEGEDKEGGSGEVGDVAVVVIELTGLEIFPTAEAPDFAAVVASVGEGVDGLRGDVGEISTQFNR